ncbi:unnamed protein product [Cochlearia groenlandica]
MGCFMGCFGLSSNKKHRNATRKILPRDQRICIYEPLLSSDPTDSTTFVDNPDKISDPNLRFVCDEEKEGTKKTRKRVRFNLNEQIYEPTRFDDEEEEEEEAQGELSTLVIEEEADDLSIRSVYPSNYRYHNCLNSFEEDEEDELGYGESDLEDEDYYTDDENDYQDDDDEDMDKDVTPLLNPVENIAQWKAAKAKPVRVKQRMKENVEEEADVDDQAKPLMKEIIVNASLNWLASPKGFRGNGSSNRSPIVDITNTENR